MKSYEEVVLESMSDDAIGIAMDALFDSNTRELLEKEAARRFKIDEE